MSFMRQTLYPFIFIIIFIIIIFILIIFVVILMMFILSRWGVLVMISHFKMATKKLLNYCSGKNPSLLKRR